MKKSLSALSITAALLAACGGSQPPIGAPGAIPQSRVIATHAARDVSWMLPEAKSEDLLYVTNYSYVSVYSYPALKLIGTLNGFKSTVGDCIDGSGNVFITNHVYGHGDTRIAEYAHGGSKPIAELANDDRIGPIGCSVDPTTGDLAVSGGGSSRGAGVNIFKRARGKATYVDIPSMVFDSFCAYDAKGDLFVDGEKNFHGRGPAFAELPHGSSKFSNIKLNATIDPSGGIQWDGQAIAVGAYYQPRKQHTPAIYRFAINGSKGTKVGMTLLGSPAYTTSFQFFVLTRAIVVPNWPYSGGKDVLLYKYPAGGAPTAVLSRNTDDPRGATISIAPSH